MAEGQHLFDYVLVVTYQKGKGPVIAYKFPQVIDVKDDIAAAAPSFCFPEGEGSSIQTSKETFSFTLTTGQGEKRFGYCRRFGSSRPECYCIVSQCSSFSLFSVILDIVEERRKASSSAVFTFLKSVLAHPLPNPGESFTVSTFSSTGAAEPEKYELSLPVENDYLLDYVSFGKLFQCLEISQIITLFECLLLECRTIFVSKKLGKLSECVNAASALLSPFSWQYVFIPVLPTSLLTYCCAPMPFIVGITSNSLRELSELPIEEIIMIDLDKGSFPHLPEVSSVLDDSIRKYLNTSLHKIKSACKIGDKTFDLNVAQCFLSLMFRYCGNYRSFLTEQAFKREEFLESQPPQYLPAVEKLVETQMWSVFIHERENLLKQGKLDSCLLVKTGYDLWNSSDLSVKCTKCNSSVTQDAHVSGGNIYCRICYEAKKNESTTFSFGTLRKLKLMMKRSSSAPSTTEKNESMQEPDASETPLSHGVKETLDGKRANFQRQLSGPVSVSPRKPSNTGTYDDMDTEKMRTRGQASGRSRRGPPRGGRGNPRGMPRGKRGSTRARGERGNPRGSRGSAGHKSFYIPPSGSNTNTTTRNRAQTDVKARVQAFLERANET